MEDEKYWKDLEAKFRWAMEGNKYLNEEQLWNLAKVCVNDDYERQKSIDKAKSLGRPSREVIWEDLGERLKVEQESKKETSH